MVAIDEESPFIKHHHLQRKASGKIWRGYFEILIYYVIASLVREAWKVTGFRI